MFFCQPMVPGRFSVIVPSFQQGRFLRRTIVSLLNQQDHDLEIIVQDGGSTDETVAILKEFSSSIQWESKPDDGQTWAINQGLRKSTGEFTCYLNSDDILYPKALKAVRQAFARDPNSSLIYGRANHIGEEDEILSPYPVEDWDYGLLLETCFICQPAAFWRRTIHEQIGGFDENLNFCMDYEFWLRAGKKFKFTHLREILAGSREHAETKTNRLRHVGHREIIQMIPNFNQGFIPLKWVRARAKTEAERSLRSRDPIWWSWWKYATIYFFYLVKDLPQVEQINWAEFKQKVFPPYWSSRKKLIDLPSVA